LASGWLLCSLRGARVDLAIAVEVEVEVVFRPAFVKIGCVPEPVSLGLSRIVLGVTSKNELVAWLAVVVGPLVFLAVASGVCDAFFGEI
jgi:hypothetical protein